MLCHAAYSVGQWSRNRWWLWFLREAITILQWYLLRLADICLSLIAVGPIVGPSQFSSINSILLIQKLYVFQCTELILYVLQWVLQKLWARVGHSQSSGDDIRRGCGEYHIEFTDNCKEHWMEMAKCHTVEIQGRVYLIRVILDSFLGRKAFEELDELPDRGSSKQRVIWSRVCGLGVMVLLVLASSD